MLKQCRICKGTGTEPATARHWFFWTKEVQVECPVCQGIGSATEEEIWAEQLRRIVPMDPLEDDRLRRQELALNSERLARSAAYSRRRKGRRRKSRNGMDAVDTAAFSALTGGNPIAAGLTAAVTGSSGLGMLAGWGDN